MIVYKENPKENTIFNANINRRSSSDETGEAIQYTKGWLIKNYTMWGL